MKTNIGETLTVGELINKLQEFPLDMPVCSDGFVEIDGAEIITWVHSNYPYDLPDEDFVRIM